MFTFLAFAFLFVTVFYGLGSLLGSRNERIKERDRTLARGDAFYHCNGYYYVGDKKAYRLLKNGRDVLVDVNDMDKVLYDITTRDQGRVREEFLKREQEAIEKAKSEGSSWYLFPFCGGGPLGAQMRKEISTGRLFTVNEYSGKRSYMIKYYKLVNPVGLGETEFIIDRDNPVEWLTTEEYYKRFLNIDYKKMRENQRMTKK